MRHLVLQDAEYLGDPGAPKSFSVQWKLRKCSEVIPRSQILQCFFRLRTKRGKKKIYMLFPE